MKTILSKKLHNYLRKHSKSESELTQHIIKETGILYPDKKQMLITQEQGELLRMLTIIKNPSHIIEVGTFTGLSTVYMAEGLESGKIITCENNEEYAKTAMSFFKMDSKISSKIKVIINDGIKTLESLAQDEKWINNTDLIFIDANKSSYKNYFELSLKLAKSKGIIIIDNTLWYNEVIEADLKNKTNKIAIKIDNFNKALQKDIRVINTIIPLGDGLSICIKK